MTFKELYLSGDPQGVHNSILLLTGVSGCGKNYLIDQVRNSNSEIDEGVNFIDVGEFLAQRIASKFDITSRDDLKLIPQNQIVNITLKILEEFISMQPVIANTHIVNKQQNSLMINPQVNYQINPKGYIHIWADPDQIKYWRDSDERSRPTESIDEIALHQNISTVVVYELAKHLGSSMVNLYNNPENTQNNIDIIVDQAQHLNL